MTKTYPTEDPLGWYRSPELYDLAFRSDTEVEAAFLEAIGPRHGVEPCKRLLEPGCGTGRLVAKMAAKGYDVTGFDLCPEPLAFCQRRLDEEGLSAHVFQADMASFTVAEPVDLAFTLCNTFRHLLEVEQIDSHFRAMEEAIRPGGLYILGLHLVPPDEDYEGFEEWVEQEGETKVSATLEELSTDYDARIETLQITLVVDKPGEEASSTFRWKTRQRVYTADEIRATIARCPAFELLEVFDFWYDIDDPLELTDDMEDTVFVLRRK